MRHALLFLARSLVFFCCCFTSAWALPAAVSGQADVRLIGFDQAETVKLDGEWEFYPGQLLSPESFSDPDRLPQVRYLALPKAVNQISREGKEFQGNGLATFRLKVLMPAVEGDYALRVFDIGSAYRLWLNGRLISSQGVVGEQAAAEIAKVNVDIVPFHNDGTPLELILEVSNHLYADGWVTSPMTLGAGQVIQAEHARQWGVALFFAGGLLLMGAYHLIFYWFRPTNNAPLLFGVYCLLWFGNFLSSTSSAWVIRLFFPELSTEFLMRFDSFCFFASVPVGFMFFYSMFPDEFSVRLMRVAQALAVIFVLIALLAPLQVLLSWVLSYYLISIVLIVYCVIRLLVARLRRRQASGFILWGFLFLGVIAANDMLYDMGVIDSVYLIHVGVFGFILAQGFALSFKLSKAFVAVERLSGELEQRNLGLEDEIVERTRLEKALVSVAENERRALSHELHDGLCQQLTAARLHCAVLERKSGNDGDGSSGLMQLSKLLESSVNIAYGLSRGLWPVEDGRLGMAAYLDEYCCRVAQASSVPISVHQALDCGRCDREQLTQLYRIAQEAINNAVKHARASRIDVSVVCDRSVSKIILSVSDDGIGRQAATATHGGLGVQMMEHRARMIHGDLKILDRETGGTTLLCTMSCKRCLPE